MQKKSMIIFLFCLIVTVSGCSIDFGPVNNQTNPVNPDSKPTEDIVSDTWSDDYQEDGFNHEAIIKEKLFYDGKYLADTQTELNQRKDLKREFYTAENMRLVNSADGYAITIPASEVEIDYSISKYRTQVQYLDSITTITFENSNPYGNSLKGWNVYFTEWFNRYIANEKYLEDNNLAYTREVIEGEALNDEFEVWTYSIVINDHDAILYPYYDISIVKRFGEYVEFYLLVTKSQTNQSNRHDKLLLSLKEIEHAGKGDVHFKLPLVKRNYWNTETSKYYDYLKLDSTFDFGFFTYSMPDNKKDYLDEYLAKIAAEEARLYSKTNYQTRIMPTYNHLNYYGDAMEFPEISANHLAGGNGFNDKPILQFTLQFTTNNNNVSSYNTSDNYTPMFDVLRGRYDEQLHRLAQDIKAYGKPVLFRLNNEMNSDWTSYCGMLTLIDPDIFRATWIYLHNIFTDEAVDNCIWIFNPIATTCPYSAWGEDLCYFPGDEYVDALGLTHYEMNNSDFVAEFNVVFQNLYDTKNKGIWDNYPWIISEFGCAAGGETTGELYRNKELQATWVSNMFKYLKNKENIDWCRNISAAVWFNCNDVSSEGIVNALHLDDSLDSTFLAFKDGFRLMEE